MMHRRSRAVALCLVLLLLILGVTVFSHASGIGDLSYASQGTEYSLEKYVLKLSCHNPVYNAKVILFYHESQGSPGVEVYRGFTDTNGWIALGDWEEGWYSINASFGGYWSYDPPFYLSQDKIKYNYLDIPPPWLA